MTRFFAENVILLRRALMVEGGDLDVVLGFPTGTWISYESGDRPLTSDILAIAKFFKMDPNDLLYTIMNEDKAAGIIQTFQNL